MTHERWYQGCQFSSPNSTKPKKPLSACLVDALLLLAIAAVFGWIVADGLDRAAKANEEQSAGWRRQIEQEVKPMEDIGK